jgi:hypothetical protein
VGGRLPADLDFVGLADVATHGDARDPDERIAIGTLRLQGEEGLP